MCANLFDGSETENGVFKDERFLYPEFVPERLPHRDREIDDLVFALKPVIRGKKPENVFVFGNPGTGKTVTVKYVLKELQEYSDRAKCVFINCFEHNSRHAVLSQISNSVGVPVPRRGTGSDEVLARLLPVLKRTDFIPIIVLDEADQLLYAGEASKIFYDLLRIVEMAKARFGLVFISNDPGLPGKLDDRVRSSLAEQQLEFHQYAPGHLKSILAERAEYAFLSAALEKDVINLVAAHAAKHSGDCRIAMSCLLRAGRLAEKENSKKLSIAHIRQAIDELVPRQEEKTAPFLSEQEKVLLELVGGTKTTSGELFDLYTQSFKNPVSLRRFREIVNGLESKGLITTQFTALKGRGRTRIIQKTK